MGLLAAGDRRAGAGLLSARNRPEGWFIVAGRLATLYYFVHFIILFPVIGWLERPLPLPTSIAAAVTKKSGTPLAAAPMEKH